MNHAGLAFFLTTLGNYWKWRKQNVAKCGNDTKVKNPKPPRMSQNAKHSYTNRARCCRIRAMPHFERNGANVKKMSQNDITEWENQIPTPITKREYLAISLLGSKRTPRITKGKQWGIRRDIPNISLHSAFPPLRLWKDIVTIFLYFPFWLYSGYFHNSYVYILIFHLFHLL